jgi:hypothetical protein
MFQGPSRGWSAILPSIYNLLVHIVQGQEQLTCFVGRLPFVEKVHFDLVDLRQYVNAVLTSVAGKAASALALPTNLVRHENGVGIQASLQGPAPSALLPREFPHTGSRRLF